MTTLNLDTYATERGITTLPALVYALRQDYTTAQSLAVLASTELVSDDPERLAYCDLEMAWFFDDLGNCFYDAWDGVRQALQNGAALANLPTTGDLRGALAGRPAICLGAGPGAAEHWDAIKASRGHAVLIVCDVMLEPCLARGIVPDYVTSMERVPQTYNALAGSVTGGITLLAVPVLEKRVIDLFRDVIWCWRGCALETWIDHRIPRNNFGRSCGVQAVGCALLAGCSPVYLVGHDLCMRGEETHCPDAQAETHGTKRQVDENDYHRRVPAKSITGRDVFTMHLWGMFKADLEYLAQEHAGQTVINTGDGLPIAGTTPGELPGFWGLPITIPALQRAEPGHDPSEMIPIMLDDIPVIRKRCADVLAAETPHQDELRLTTMVDPKTAGAWTEIYGSTYAAALIRLYLQPAQHHAMLRRVANVIIHTLPQIERELHAIKAS